MFKIFYFIQSVWQELKYKVSWPSQEQLQRMVTFFIIGVIICTCIVGALNVSFKKVLDFVYSKF